MPTIDSNFWEDFFLRNAVEVAMVVSGLLVAVIGVFHFYSVALSRPILEASLEDEAIRMGDLA